MSRPRCRTPHRSSHARSPRRSAEAQLLRLWREGDASAGRRLLSRYRRELLSYFRRRAPAQAEDLTQAVLLACVEARDRIRDDDGFRYYAYGVAWRKLLRARKMTTAEALPPEAEISGSEDDPEVGYQQIERRRLLHERVASLSPTNRRTVELYYFEQLKGHEIAEVLRVPHATVRSRLLRGVEALRHSLGAAASRA